MTRNVRLIGQPRTVTERDGVYTVTPAIGPDPDLLDALARARVVVEVRCNREDKRNPSGRCGCRLARVWLGPDGLLGEVAVDAWDDRSPQAVVGRAAGVKAPAVTHHMVVRLVDGQPLRVADHGRRASVEWHRITAAITAARAAGHPVVVHPT